MSSVEPNVILIQAPKDPIKILYAAARQCYSNNFSGDYFTDNRQTIDYESAEMLIQDVINSGHISIIEHISYTFAIEGVSRSESHQHVRHRMASYSQQSQRYCNATKNGEFNYIIPPSIKNNIEALQEFLETIYYLNEKYDKLVEILSRNNSNKEKVNEDARYILPNACETKFTTTMNASSLLHFFEVRTCNRAQWEIRSVAKQMLQLCKQNCPIVFESAGPKCKKIGYCPEGNRSCGKLQL